MKKSTSFRLSDEAKELIAELSNKLGLSDASTVELAVRLLDSVTDQTMIEMAARAQIKKEKAK